MAALSRHWVRLLERLFPAPCLGCGAWLGHAPNAWFCAPCWGRVAGACGGVCDGCGLPFDAAAAAAGTPGWRCGHCMAQPPEFAMARALGAYEGVLAAAIKAIKYREMAALVPVIVAELELSRYPARLWDADVLVPVPLFPERLIRRGFNQADRIADALGARLALPVAAGALIRVARGHPQVGLSRPERERNVRRAFAVRDAAGVHGKRVLLVDDVMTTGATANACARVLKDAGAAQVHVWTLARQGHE